MKLRGVTAVAAGLVLTLSAFVQSASAQSEGVRVGWAERDGVVLLNELKCNSCHASEELSALAPVKIAPHLKEVGQRVTPQFLQAWLNNPQSVKPGTAMPDVMQNLPANDKAQAVKELTHYLSSLGGPINQSEEGSSASEIESGRMLYHSVGCVACHKPDDPPPAVANDPYANLDPEDLAEIDLPNRSEPWDPIPHGDLASKYTVTSLTGFLRNPAHSRPSGRMPSLKLDESEARQIAAYLLRAQMSDEEQGYQPGLQLTVYTGTFEKVMTIPDGKKVMEGATTTLDVPDRPYAIGDGKTLRDNFGLHYSGIIDIPSDGEYSFRTKSDDGSILLIGGKPVVNNDNVHAPTTVEGKVRLTKGKHPIELLFAEVGGGHELTTRWRPQGESKWSPIPTERLQHKTLAMVPAGRIDFQVDSELAKAGQARFTALGCNSCHSVDGKTDSLLKPFAKSLAAVDVTSDPGCLNASSAPKNASYSISEAQRKTLLFGLEDLKAKPLASVTPERKLDVYLTALNCYACHERNGKGGAEIRRSSYFSTLIQVDLGDEGRLPPQLHDTGAKLTDAGFEATFHGKDKYRTFIATRMPHFGKPATAALPNLFRSADKGKIPAHTMPPSTKPLVNGGWKLTGRTGMGCINCHQWGQYKMQGAEGLDFLRVPGRIRPEWFHAFLSDPQELKPGTRMPTAWPPGKTLFPEIEGGDKDAQIDAIWAYLSQGKTARIPIGLENGKQLLDPIEEPVVFRTFVDGVGARAITVGYPERVHVAFDALRCRTALAWQGDFISTKPAWDGRAGQYASPAGDAVITMPAGFAFARLSSLETEWPTMPNDTRVSPKGWQFLGYRFDEKRNPIFRYSMDGITIEERISIPENSADARVRREFTLTSKDAPQDMYFRSAVGTDVRADGRETRIGDSATIQYSGASSVTHRTSAGQSEALLPVQFKDGKATFAIETTWK